MGRKLKTGRTGAKRMLQTIHAQGGRGNDAMARTASPDDRAEGRESIQGQDVPDHQAAVRMSNHPVFGRDRRVRKRIEMSDCQIAGSYPFAILRKQLSILTQSGLGVLFPSPRSKIAVFLPPSSASRFAATGNIDSATKLEEDCVTFRQRASSRSSATRGWSQNRSRWLSEHSVA